MILFPISRFSLFRKVHRGVMFPVLVEPFLFSTWLSVVYVCIRLVFNVPCVMFTVCQCAWLLNAVTAFWCVRFVGVVLFSVCWLVFASLCSLFAVRLLMCCCVMFGDCCVRDVG